MRVRSLLLLLMMYFAFLLIFVVSLTPKIHAEPMSHEKIMDGFVHAQKAPQMGRPVIYLPSRKMFKHKKHKGHPNGQQRFGRKLPVTPSTPSPSPVASATPGNGPSVTPTTIITPGGVDLRARDSVIKDQIGPICTAYSGNAGIENLLGRDAPDFSEDYTFSLYGQYSVDAFATTVPGKALALSAMWPRGGNQVDKFSTTSHKLISITYLGDGEIGKMKASLQASHPVYLGLEVPADMASCLASIRPTTRVTSGGHAVLIVGYKDDDSNKSLGGGYFTIKNSWSDGCGDHGYQYIPYSYCEKSYCYMYEMSKAE